MNDKENLRVQQVGTDWRERLQEAFIKSQPIKARIGNDEYEIRVSGSDTYLTKGTQLLYSSTGTKGAYVLAKFFIAAKESVRGMLGPSLEGRVVDRCVLEGFIRDALDSNLVVGKDAEKLRDVLSSIFYSEDRGKEHTSEDKKEG